MQASTFTATATAATGQCAAHLAQRVKTSALFAWVVASIFASTGPVGAADPVTASTVFKATASEQVVGVFTGTYDHGIPVYRLPTINVTADRKTELAKIEQEQKRARAKAAAIQSVGKDSPKTVAEGSAPALCTINHCPSIAAAR